MRHRTYHKLLSSIFCLALTTTAFAGEWYVDKAPCRSDFDWQWFAPIHDVCADPNPKARDGYFATAERMHGIFLRPDRAAIGNPVDNTDPNTQVFAWLPNSVNYVFADNMTTASGFNLSTNAAATLSFLFPVVGGGADGYQFNGIDDAYTEAGTGSGERFTFGRLHGDSGWELSVIYDLDIRNSALYGFDDKRLDQLAAAQGTDGIDGILVDTNGDGVIDANDGMQPAPVAPQPGLPSVIAIDGLLAVAVNFADPFNLLNGIRDENADNVNDVVPGNTTPDNDDPATVRIAVVFDDMSVENQTRMDGIEANFIRRKRRLRSGFDVEGYLGVRYLSLDDRFSVVARGGALGDSNWNNNADNRIIGPTIGFRASRQQYRWITRLSAKFMAGANFLSIRQDGLLGSHLTTGHPGVPISLGGNALFNRLGDERFSPVGEFKAETAVQVTRHINLKAGYTGMVVGNIARASNTVVYEIPTLGIRNGREEMFGHALSLGFEINR